MMGISQTALGDALGLTFQQVQKYEKGANRISASRLQHIAHILTVPESFFFEGAPNGGVGGNASSAPMPSYVADFMATTDGLALSKAFVSIRNAKLRSCIVRLVEGLGDGTN